MGEKMLSTPRTPACCPLTMLPKSVGHGDRSQPVPRTRARSPLSLTQPQDRAQLVLGTHQLQPSATWLRESGGHFRMESGSSIPRTRRALPQWQRRGAGCHSPGQMEPTLQAGRMTPPGPPGPFRTRLRGPALRKGLVHGTGEKKMGLRGGRGPAGAVPNRGSGSTRLSTEARWSDSTGQRRVHPRGPGKLPLGFQKAVLSPRHACRSSCGHVPPL